MQQLINNQDFMALENYLLQYRSKPIVFIPNQGNAGDIMIASGTLYLFEKLGMQFEFGQFSETFEGKNLFYGGGGNLVGTYEVCRSFLERNLTKNHITLLPATIKDEDLLISQFNQNIDIFCREKISYEYVQKLTPHPENVFLSPDLAFYIQNTERFKTKKRSGVGTLYRTDLERAPEEHLLNPKNFDISVELMKAITYLNPEGIKTISEKMLDFVSDFELVETDRLHVAIACYLTNTYCELKNNNYYKNKAVFEYSMKDSEFVKFID